MDHVYQLLEFRIMRISRVGQVIFHDQTQAAGIGNGDSKCGRHFHRFSDFFCHHEDALQRQDMLLLFQSVTTWFRGSRRSEHPKDVKSFVQAEDLPARPRALASNSQPYVAVACLPRNFVMIFIEANAIQFFYQPLSLCSIFFTATLTSSQPPTFWTTVNQG